jgi:hypothetical protein
VDLLVCASQHLFSLPPSTWRPAMAAQVYMAHIFPVLEVFIALEEDAQLMAIASAGGNVAALENPTIQRTKLQPLHIQVSSCTTTQKFVATALLRTALYNSAEVVTKR